MDDRREVGRRPDLVSVWCTMMLVKWLGGGGALSIASTGMQMLCTCDARCCPSMHKTAAVAKPDG